MMRWRWVVAWLLGFACPLLAQAPELVIQQALPDTITAAAVSSDGEWLAAGSAVASGFGAIGGAGQVQVRDTRTGLVLGRWDLPREPGALLFLPGQPILVAAPVGGTGLVFLNLDTGARQDWPLAFSWNESNIALGAMGDGRLAVSGLDAEPGVFCYRYPDGERLTGWEFPWDAAPTALLPMPDGRRLLVGDDKGGWHLLDPEQGVLAGEERPRDAQARPWFALSPDGTRLAVAAADPEQRHCTRVRMIHLADRAEVWSTGALPPEPRDLIFSADGAKLYLAAWAEQAEVHELDAATGRRLADYDTPATRFARLPNGAVACLTAATTSLLDPTASPTYRALQLPDRAGLAVAPDGRHLAASWSLAGLGDRPELRLFDAADGRELPLPLRDAASSIYSADDLMFTRDGSLLAAERYLVGRWDPAAATRSAAWLTLPDDRTVSDSWCSPTGDRALAVSTDRRLYLCSLTSAAPARELTADGDEDWDDGAFSPDGRLAFAARGKMVCAWTTSDGQAAWTWRHALSDWLRLAAGPSRLAIASSVDLTLVDSATGELLAQVPNPGEALAVVEGLAWDPAGTWLAVLRPPDLYVHDGTTGAIVQRWESPDTVAIAAQGGNLVRLTRDGVIHRVSPLTGDELPPLPLRLRRTPVLLARTSPTRTGVPDSLALSADGRTLATSRGRAVHLWDLEQAVEAGTVTATDGMTLAFSALALAPDGRLFALDQAARLFTAEPAAGGRVATLEPFGPPPEELTATGWWRFGDDLRPAQRLVVSSDGARLAAVLGDGPRVLSVATGNEAVVLRCDGLAAEGGPLFGDLDWSPAGDRLAVVGNFGVAVWDADGALVAQTSAAALARAAGLEPQIDGEPPAIRTLQFLPDGALLVCQQGRPLLLDPRTLELRRPVTLAREGWTETAATGAGWRAAVAVESAIELLGDSHGAGQASCPAKVQAGAEYADRGPVAAFSHDGHRVAVVGGDSIAVYELPATGLPAGATWDAPTDGVERIAFSPDGSHLAAVEWEDQVRVFARDGRIALELPGDDFVWAPDGHRLAVMPPVTLEDLTLEETPGPRPLIRILELGRPEPVVELAESDSPYLNEFHLGNDPPALLFSPDGDRILGWDRDDEGGRQLVVWDAASGQLVGRHALPEEPEWSDDWRDHPSPLPPTRWLSADATRLVELHSSGTLATVYDTRDGRVLHRREVAPGSALYLTADLNRLVRISGTAIRVEDLDGTPRQEILNQGEPWATWATAFSSDGRYVALTSWGWPADESGEVELLDLATGSLVAQREYSAAQVALHLSADGHDLLSIGADGSLNRWTLGSNLILAGHQAPIRGLLATPDGRRMISAATDGSIAIWEPLGETPATPRATLLETGEESYLFFTPDGHYTASRGGLGVVGWRVGSHAYPFDQFDLRFNQPHRVLARLGAAPEQVEAYRRAYQHRLARSGVTIDEEAPLSLPEVTLDRRALPLTTADRAVELPITARAAAGLSRLRVDVNGVPVHGAAGLPLEDSPTSVSRTLEVSLSAGANRIQVAAVDRHGAESLRETIEVRCTAAAAPRLFVLAIGVADYRDPTRALRYAAKDAEELARFLTETAGTRYREVIPRVLTDAEVTRAALPGARAFLEQAAVDDVAVVSVSAHGLLDDQSDYYLATYDTDFADPAGAGIRWDELEGLLDGLAVRRKLLLVDTCHAGEVRDEPLPAPANRGDQPVLSVAAAGKGGELVVTPGLGLAASVDLVGALFADVRRGTGAHVIAAASGRDVALESATWGHGAFTYAVLAGLRDRTADANADGEVTVVELREFVTDAVVQLTAGWQQPVVRQENVTDDFVVY